MAHEHIGHNEQDWRQERARPEIEAHIFSKHPYLKDQVGPDLAGDALHPPQEAALQVEVDDVKEKDKGEENGEERAPAIKGRQVVENDGDVDREHEYALEPQVAMDTGNGAAGFFLQQLLEPARRGVCCCGDLLFPPDGLKGVQFHM